LHAETITIVADEWPPFNIVPDKQPEGYMVDVVREVFGAVGIKVEYKIVPWNRAKDSTLKGDYTAVIGASKKSAPNLVFPKEELICNKISFWVKKGSKWRYISPTSLDTVSLGLIEGYDYRKTLNDYVKQHRKNYGRIQFVSGTNPLEMNIRKLIAGRIGALVDNEPVVRYTSRQMGVSEKIEMAGSGNEVTCGYIAFSPANPRSKEYARILSEGIVKLRKSGRLEEILAVYGMNDWKEH
jgi:polar amino acid transport system substrate-binding protein